MGWVSDHKTTILEAFTLRRVVAISILIAVVTVAVRVSTALSNFLAQREGQMLLGAPSWAWGLITALVAGLLLATYFFLEYANRLRLQIEPKIKISFNPNADGIVRTPTEVYSGGKKLFDDEAVYIGITLQACRRPQLKIASHS